MNLFHSLWTLPSLGWDWGPFVHARPNRARGCKISSYFIYHNDFAYVISWCRNLKLGGYSVLNKLKATIVHDLRSTPIILQSNFLRNIFIPIEVEVDINIYTIIRNSK